MPTLHNIAEEYAEILNQCNEEEIISEELINNLEKIDEDFQNKTQNIVYVIQELKTQCDAIKREIERLENRFKIKSKNSEKLQEYLKNKMLLVGKKKLEMPIYTVSISESIETDVDEEKFSDWACENNQIKLVRAKFTYTPNKKLIREKIEKGELKCPFVRLVKNLNLKIR